MDGVTGEGNPPPPAMATRPGGAAGELSPRALMPPYPGGLSGIYIYSGGALPAMGDSVIVSGEISEFCWDGSSPCNCSTCGGAGVTEFYQPEDIYVISNNNPLPEPILVSSGEALSEEYEGVLVRIEGVECTILPNGFGVWQVDDGTGECGIHNTPDGYEFDPQIGTVYNITGIVTSTFNEWKIDLRIPEDVEFGADVFPPFILTHNCQQSGDNYIVTLYFNEAIDPVFLDADNFLLTGASIASIDPGFFDPTQIILTLTDIISNSMGLIIYEMGDLNQNLGTNLTYNINCEFNIDLDELSQDFNLFPNPNTGEFHINLNAEENAVSVFDVKGQVVFTNKLNRGTHIININKAGFYYLEINNYKHIPLIVH